jgi:hypothetical protein
MARLVARRCRRSALLSGTYAEHTSAYIARRCRCSALLSGTNSVLVRNQEPIKSLLRRPSGSLKAQYLVELHELGLELSEEQGGIVRVLVVVELQPRSLLEPRPRGP